MTTSDRGGHSGSSRLRWWQVGCRLHGYGCRAPWGWDPAHTDSPRPYTVDELAARAETPHRYAYATHTGYLHGWQLWRALRRDGRLTAAERLVQWQVLEAELEHRRVCRPGVSDECAGRACHTC